MIDVLVAGAGPVGLATAIHAAIAGLDVTVVEPRSGPIDKACGEGVMPGALAGLARIGVNPPGHSIRGIRYVAGRRSAQAAFSEGPGRGVRRTTLHTSLTERAHEVGVRFVTGSVTTVAQQPAWIEAAGIRARYLIGADGLHSSVRRSLGLAPGSRSRSRVGIRQRFGIRRHFAVRPWTDLVEVYWLDDVEVYVTPVDECLVGVAVLGRAPVRLAGAIARLPELAARLGAGEPVSSPRGAGPLRQRVRSRHLGRALLVGDAAGYVDALTGEGLRVGFAEAEAAIRAVLANDPARYEGEWVEITRSYRWLTEGLLWASSISALRPLIVPAARSVPAAFGRLVDVVAN